MKKVRIAFCGHRGHVDKFARMVNSYPESEAAAFWDDEKPEEAKKFAEQFQCAYYDDYEEMVADPQIDGLVISMTNNRNAELILKAVNAGKSVFVEKPLCMDVHEAYAVRDAVNANNVKFFMTDPFVNAAQIWEKQMIESGKLGKLLSVRCRFSNTMFHMFARHSDSLDLAAYAKAMGGGIMADTGNHPVHAVTYLLGFPETVYGRTGYLSEEARNLGFDQYATVVYTYPEDVTATMEISFVAPQESNAIEIHGTRGSIIDHGFAENGKHDLQYMIVMDEEHHRKWFTVEKDELPEAPDDHIRYFVRMLAEDLPNDIVGVDPKSLHGVSLDTAVKMVEICDAFYTSVKTGKAEIVGQER